MSAKLVIEIELYGASETKIAQNALQLMDCIRECACPKGSDAQKQAMGLETLGVVRGYRVEHTNLTSESR